MVTRQEAQEAMRQYFEREGKPAGGYLVDGGNGRWLLVHASHRLAVDADGQVRPVSEVFSPEEYQRLVWSLP